MRIHSIHTSIFFFLSGAALAFGQKAFSSSDDPKPISGKERLNWVTRSTLGPTSLLGASFSAGLSTLTDARPSYGPHWDGFGKRVGINVAGSAVSKTMEAGLGAAWGEDPRYTRDAEGREVSKKVNLTLRIRSLGGATMDNEWNYVQCKLMRALGVVFLENQARI